MDIGYSDKRLICTTQRAYDNKIYVKNTTSAFRFILFLPAKETRLYCNPRLMAE